MTQRFDTSASQKYATMMLEAAETMWGNPSPLKCSNFKNPIKLFGKGGIFKDPEKKMPVDATTAYLYSVKSRIQEHIETSKTLELPGMFPTSCIFQGVQYGPMMMGEDDYKKLFKEDPELVLRWDSAPNTFKKIEEAADGTVTFMIWPESLWHWQKLLTDISNEIANASS